MPRGHGSSLGASPRKWQHADPDRTASDDDHASRLKLGFEPREVGKEHGCLLGWRHRLSDPEQDVRGEGGMGSGEERSEVRVLGDHHPVIIPAASRTTSSSAASSPFTNMDRIVAGVAQTGGDRDRQVGVDEQPHPSPTSGNSRSCTASAANSRAASMSSGSRRGKSARICSRVRPAASCPRTVLTGIRSPRMHGSPPIWFGLIVIRSYDTPPDYGAGCGRGARVQVTTVLSDLVVLSGRRLNRPNRRDGAQARTAPGESSGAARPSREEPGPVPA